MASNGTDRRDAQHKNILKGTIKGNETQAIKPSTLLQNNPMVLSLQESKDWESAKVSSLPSSKSTQVCPCPAEVSEGEFSATIRGCSINVLVCHSFKTKTPPRSKILCHTHILCWRTLGSNCLEPLLGDSCSLGKVANGSAWKQQMENTEFGFAKKIQEKSKPGV